MQQGNDIKKQLITASKLLDQDCELKLEVNLLVLAAVDYDGIMTWAF